VQRHRCASTVILVPTIGKRYSAVVATETRGKKLSEPTMTVATVTPSSHHHALPIRRAFLGFRFKPKGSPSKQAYARPDSPPVHLLPPPRQACNPAIYPLINKPAPREENFVLLPSRNASIKRKRDPNSPIRQSVKPKGTEPWMNEWTRYLNAYTKVSLTFPLSSTSGGSPLLL